MKVKEEAVVLVFLSVLTLVIVTLLVLALSQISSRTALSLELEVDRIAMAAVQAFLRGEETPQAVDGRVLGFGLYGPEGGPIHRSGTAPAALPAEATRPGGGGLQMRRDTVRLVRPLVPMRGTSHMPMMRAPMRGRMMGPEAFVFLEMRHTGAPHRGSHILLSVLGSVTVVALMGTVAHLYTRNAGYRRAMARQQKLAELGEAARTLAHEIKNPLGAIRIQTGYLRKLLPPEHREDLTPIEHEVARLALLADRVGAFLREPAGDPRPVELVPFLQDLMDRTNGRAMLEVSDGAGPLVHVDPDRFRSVMENLIGNALESQHEAGTGAPIEIVLRPKGRSVQICVRDRGKGLPAGARERLFEPFFTTKTNGSGVGLALTRRFVEAAGGRVELDDRPGGGAEAVLTLPEAPG